GLSLLTKLAQCWPTSRLQLAINEPRLDRERDTDISRQSFAGCAAPEICRLLVAQCQLQPAGTLSRTEPPDPRRTIRSSTSSHGGRHIWHKCLHARSDARP